MNMRKVLGNSLVALILAGCSAGSENVSVDKPAKQVPPISDAELADLVPEFVDAQTMPWLAGTWGVLEGSGYAGSNCEDGGFMDIAIDGYVFAFTSDPEPGQEPVGKSHGTVNISKGQDPGFFNLTPPKWEDAYFRLKPRSKDRLTAHIWSFSSAQTAWFKTHEFEFERCGT